MSKPEIILTDEDREGKLKNYCYTYCDNECNYNIKQSRRLVYTDNTPFLKSFGYTPQYTIETIDVHMQEFIKNNIKTLRFYDSYEGTLIRLFYNDINNKWYISTHRKLNAEKSRWGSSETFGDKFKSIIPENFYTTLNKDLHYMFLLTPNENNRIVCNTTNLVLHIGTYDSQFNLTTDYNIGVPRPTEHKFNTYEDFIIHLQTKTDITKIQGLIIHDENTQTNIKIYNEKYYEYYKVRNNVPSIMFRYLQLRNDDNMKNKMHKLYPKHVTRFAEYENALWNIADKLFNCYMNRFVKKIHTTVSPQENVILKTCHGWHLQNKQTNKMSKEKVMEIMNGFNAEMLNKLIKINK